MHMYDEIMTGYSIKLICVMILIVSAGCASGRLDRMEEIGKQTCDFVAVYAGDSSSLPPGAKREDKHWVRVRAVLSESGFDFGYLNDRGNFIKFFSGAESTFECLGGVYYPFAIRTGPPDVQVYSMPDHGSCEPAGDSIAAGRAVRPAAAGNYTTAVKLHFLPPDRQPVTVLLTATSPNGFVFD